MTGSIIIDHNELVFLVDTLYRVKSRLSKWKIVAIDGPDNVGKTTLLSELQMLFETVELDCIIYEQPIYAYRERIVQNKSISEMERILLLLKSAEITNDYMLERTKTDTYGGIILLDRSVISSLMAYNLLLLPTEEDEKMLCMILGHGLENIYRPDLIIHLTCDPFGEPETDYVAARQDQNQIAEVYRYMADPSNQFQNMEQVYRGTAEHFGNKLKYGIHSAFLKSIKRPVTISTTSRYHRYLEVLNHIYMIL